MGDLTELADQAAEALLTAIRDQARTASDLKLLQLAQAYSMVDLDRGQHKAGGRGRNRRGGILSGV